MPSVPCGVPSLPDRLWCRAAPPLVSAALLATLVAGLLAGCASKPGGPRAGRDGPGASPPANLAQIPDAEPRAEAIRSGGTNKPYTVLGRSYTPLDAGAAYRETGLASWYGAKFHGASTSNGERYDMYAMTAAHPTMPIPSYAWVRNPANGREVIVRVNDRGPFHDGRIIDLSYTAAYKLDLLRGVAPVEVERITPTQIASGDWRRGAATTLATSAPPVPAAQGQVGQVEVPAALVAPAAYVPAVSVPPAEMPLAEPSTALVAVPIAVATRSADQDIGTTPRYIEATPLPALPALAPPPSPSSMGTSEARGVFWVQLGAFSRPEGADAMVRRAGPAAAGTTVAVWQDGALRRVQAGPFPSREAARDAALRLGEALQMTPVVVERR